MGTITRLYYNKIKILVNKIQDFLYKIIYKKIKRIFIYISYTNFAVLIW